MKQQQKQEREEEQLYLPRVMEKNSRNEKKILIDDDVDELKDSDYDDHYCYSDYY